MVTTIGIARDGGGSPVIGNCVDIGCNSVIIGDITVGNNVTIGAGSVVLKDVPDDVVIVGNPAKTVKRKSIDGMIKNQIMAAVYHDDFVTDEIYDRLDY